jgi:hypothetical protein
MLQPSARLHPGPIPTPAATEKYAIFAGLLVGSE